MRAGAARSEAIPLAGRIVDVFDALFHDRPYKLAWPLDDAVAETVGASGTQFAPRVVGAFKAPHDAGALDLLVAEPPTGGPAAPAHRRALSYAPRR